MSAIEFTSNPGKTFVASVRDPADGYSLLATGIACTEITSTRYRASLGVLTGLVWIEAIAGATKAVGFADLDRPASNGYSDVVDAIDNATGEKQDTLIALLTNGTVTSIAPVTTTGTIANIVIGDDYKNASGRAFSWLVAVPTFAQVGSKCYFGGEANHKGQWLVEGTITPVTIDDVPKWQLLFELASTDTDDCKPGCYDWSVELRGPAPEQITKILGTTELIEAYTR